MNDRPNKINTSIEAQKATAWEASLYWRCHCGYENQHMWDYDGDKSYNFICDGCGCFYNVDPPGFTKIHAKEPIK